ncbi:MAG: DUF4280 domain-containing protein [Lachnospiraceae bacterium]|nr:DUF4280 domain-containing protein [Lachnospiraceae bacterium]
MEDVKVTVVEDTRESLKDFLDMAQEVESLDEEEQQKKLEEIFGPADEEETGQEDEGEEETEEAKSTEEQNREEQMKGRQESRANSDVVMAMMIADQVAAESMPDTPCYVVHGAKLLCSMGSREARLVVPLDHGILLGSHPQMTADDCASLTNVMCFGNCFSAENPAMEQAAVDATNQYNIEKSQGFWGKVKSFFGVKPKTVDSVSKELQQLCICECTPCILPDAIWEESNDKSLINDKKTLIQPAVLVCEHGGVIRIIDNGQNEQSEQNG